MTTLKGGQCSHDGFSSDILFGTGPLRWAPTSGPMQAFLFNMVSPPPPPHTHARTHARARAQTQAHRHTRELASSNRSNSQTPRHDSGHGMYGTAQYGARLWRTLPLPIPWDIAQGTLDMLCLKYRQWYMPRCCCPVCSLMQLSAARRACVQRGLLSQAHCVQACHTPEPSCLGLGGGIQAMAPPACGAQLGVCRCTPGPTPANSFWVTYMVRVGSYHVVLCPLRQCQCMLRVLCCVCSVIMALTYTRGTPPHTVSSCACPTTFVTLTLSLSRTPPPLKKKAGLRHTQPLKGVD